MSFTSIGDLASHLQLRQSNASLKGHLNRLTAEVASGRVGDPARRLSGDLTLLAGLDRRLAQLAASQTVAAEATLVTDSMQAALGSLADLTAGFGIALQDAAQGGDAQALDALSVSARDRLEAAIGTLNLQLADRFAFSGPAYGDAPVASVSDILAALRTRIAGAATVTEVAAAVGDWFDAPAGGGGYLDEAFGGVEGRAISVPLAAGRALEVTLTAADPGLRDVIAGLALAALTEPGGAFEGAERRQLAELAGGWVLSSQAGLTDLRAELGVAQERVALAATSAAAERTALEISRAALVETDAYDASTDLVAVQSQLEALYAVTAKLSQLRLSDYLR